MISPVHTTSTTVTSSTRTVNGRVVEDVTQYRKLEDGREIDPFTWAEISRVISLPCVRPMDEHEIECFNRDHIQAQYFEKGFRLFNTQAEAVSAYELFGGLFAPIGVGWGKTLITLMVANAAYAKGLQRMLLLVPPEVTAQLVETDIPWARSRVAINYPIHVLGGRPMDYRRSLCNSKRKGLYIMPYSLLSTKDTSDNLAAMQPELLIADEAHKLAKASAARTRRVIHMLEDAKKRGKPMEMVLLSGTITKKSIKDYYHLIVPCLKNNCPLPLSGMMANDWAALVDAQASSADSPPAATTPIIPLVQWARKHFPDLKGGFPMDVQGFRAAYKHRLNTAPGVVSSGDAQIGTSLILANRPVEGYEANPGWKELKRLMDQVTNMWLTPNGDEIEHAIHTWKWLNELSTGFYNELTWPTPAKLAEKRRLPEKDAEEILTHARIHHTSGQMYAKLLRDFLMNSSRPGLDTPFLVGQDMMRNAAKHVPATMYTAWREWKDLDFEGRPERDSRAVRVCDYKIKAAVAWAKAMRAEEGKGRAGAIVWYYHQEVGTWLAEEMRLAGLDTLHCPAGDRGNADILNPAHKHKIVVASYTAHGTGKNLQHFQEQYFVQWPRDASVAEQTLGRTHRNGQLADELTVHTNQTLLFDQLNFAACLNDSLYIHQSTGNRQKLIYASYDPLPKIFPPAVLYQRGLETTKLDDRQEQMLREKFGGYSKV